MEREWIKDQTFEKVNDLFNNGKGEYEGCTFRNSMFSAADLSDNEFNDCVFAGCDLSMANISRTAFRNVVFRECKLMGLHFDRCNPFNLSLRFEHCILDHASFYQVKLKATVYSNCQLREADFTECDLTGAALQHCDLTGARFDHTILEKADLRSALHYTIDPAANRIKKAKFSLPGVLALLEPYGIEIS